nr:response regulator [Methylobacterium ajmalii]
MIEEDPLVGLAVGETLAEAGYRVAGPLATQAQALAWMAGRVPDLAVIDLPLRDGDGSRLARALRARGVPFLVHADRSADACTELSLAPRLTKPAWHRDLVLVLDQLAREVRPE